MLTDSVSVPVIVAECFVVDLDLERLWMVKVLVLVELSDSVAVASDDEMDSEDVRVAVDDSVSLVLLDFVIDFVKVVVRV